MGFPAVLGLNNPVEVVEELREFLGLPVFEIPTLPPSIPGIRIHNILISAIERRGGQIMDGMEILSADTI